MMRRAVAGLSAVLLVVVALTGCTANWLLGGAGPSSGPSASDPSGETTDPQPSTSTTPTDALMECDDLVIEEPGAYELGDCGLVTVVGDRIEVTALSIGELVIRGDRNEVAVTGAIASVIVDGDDNMVDAEGPLGPVTESGQGNEIG